MHGKKWNFITQIEILGTNPPSSYVVLKTHSALVKLGFWVAASTEIDSLKSQTILTFQL